mmetsp:Transcript_12892/g.36988  ORF Transcript_12892/g.36988 Transcript_12892/m.36988 type:complete len:236 (-) Transcript_12892:1181-1888(-)
MDMELGLFPCVATHRAVQPFSLVAFTSAPSPNSIWSASGLSQKIESMSAVNAAPPPSIPFRSTAFMPWIRLISAMSPLITALCRSSSEILRRASMQSLLSRPRSPIVVLASMDSSLPLKENKISSGLQPFLAHKASMTRWAFVDVLTRSRTSPWISSFFLHSLPSESLLVVSPSSVALTNTTKLLSDRTLMMALLPFSLAYSSGVLPLQSTAVGLASYLLNSNLTVSIDPAFAAM